MHLDSKTQRKIEEDSFALTSLEQTKLLELSRQQKNLLLMRPVFELEFRKNAFHCLESEKPLFEKLDTNFLVLNLLDDLMEAVAVDTGRTTDEVIHHLAEIVYSMLPSMGEKDCVRAAEIVLDAIANRSEKYKSFEFEYFDSPSHSLQTYRFKLVDYKPRASDTYRFVPTREGYLVYLGMLDLAPEMPQN